MIVNNTSVGIAEKLKAKTKSLLVYIGEVDGYCFYKHPNLGVFVSSHALTQATQYFVYKTPDYRFVSYTPLASFQLYNKFVST